MNLWLLYTTYYTNKILLWICDYYTPLTNKSDYYEFVITIHHFNILIKTTLWICDYYTPLNILIKTTMKTTTMNLWLLYTT